MKNESFEALQMAFLDEFPDETMQLGQRLKKRQVEIINALIMELKERKQARTAS